MNDLFSIASELRVMVIDDTHSNLTKIKGTLASENYKHAFANNGEKAFKIIPNFSPNLILKENINE
jgi:PleD family two-component response regulator